MSDVRISTRLKKNAHMDPSKESQSKSIVQLCQELEDSILIMPIFQRGLAWNLTKKIALFNFQLNGAAPVSPISINKIGSDSNDMPHVMLLSRKDIASSEVGVGKLSVIDGQQRISTNYQAYINADCLKDVMLNISRGIFIEGDSNNIKRYEIPVGVLYNKSPDVFDEYIKKNSYLSDFKSFSLLQQIRSKFMNYYYTVNFAHNLSGSDQIEWFNVLNLAGSSVSSLEMKLTILQIKGLDFYKEYAKPFIGIFEQNGYDVLFTHKKTEVSIPLSTLNPAYEVILKKEHSSNYSPMASDAKPSAVLSMGNEDLRKAFQLALKSIEKTFDFIQENDLQEPTRIDEITYLAGYFIYNNSVSSEKKDKLVKWYSEIDFAKQDNTKRRMMFTELIKL
ncbi:DUF262 domain-containing protein [Listeria booriae]|uniref:DUF262 domain-containing protein n=1 Tax=Listeria booriae TaxID=1552123 RepID=UPI00289349B2|nr:DUF262 domain-containing protein [Listeria booriae]